MYKAIFIDIDGTLRNPKRELTQKTIDAVTKATEKGILIVLCTGRPRKYTELVSRECGACNYIITSGGSHIYDYENKKVLYTNPMNPVACKKLYEIAEKAGVRFMMDVGDIRVVNIVKQTDGSEVLLDTDIDTFFKRNEAVQCIIADEDYDKIKVLQPEIEKVEGVVIKNKHKSLEDENAPKEGTIYYDVANENSNKGNAIEKFCEILNINLKDTIGIGDGLNDLAMRQKVGYFVAMGNAKNEVKQCADEITASNTEDGVAIFLEKLLYCNETY